MARITIGHAPITIESVKDLALRICARNSEYQDAFPYIERAWRDAIRHELRIDTSTGTMRDNRLGILMQSREPEQISASDATEMLIREVWSIAVRYRNIEKE